MSVFALCCRETLSGRATRIPNATMLVLLVCLFLCIQSTAAAVTGEAQPIKENRSIALRGRGVVALSQRTLQNNNKQQKCRKKFKRKFIRQCNLQTAEMAQKDLKVTASKATKCATAVKNFQTQTKNIQKLLQQLQAVPGKLQGIRVELLLLRDYLNKVQPKLVKIKVVGIVFVSLERGIHKLRQLVTRIADYAGDLDARIQELDTVMQNLEIPVQVSARIANASRQAAKAYGKAIRSSAKCRCAWSTEITHAGTSMASTFQTANGLLDVCTTTFTPLDSIQQGLERLVQAAAKALPEQLVQDLTALFQGIREYTETFVSVFADAFDVGKQFYCCNAAMALLRQDVLSIVKVYQVASCYKTGSFDTAGGSALDVLDKLRSVLNDINQFSLTSSLNKFSLEYNDLVVILQQATNALGGYLKLTRNKNQLKRIPVFSYKMKGGPKIRTSAWKSLPRTVKQGQVTELAPIDLSLDEGSFDNVFDGAAVDVLKGCYNAITELFDRPTPCCSDALDCSTEDQIILWSEPYCQSQGSKTGTLPVLDGSFELTHTAIAKFKDCIQDNAARALRIVGPAPAGLIIQVMEDADDPCENDYATIELKKNIQADDLLCIDIFTEDYSNQDYSVQYKNKNGKLRLEAGAASRFEVMVDNTMLGFSGCCLGRTCTNIFDGRICVDEDDERGCCESGQRECEDNACVSNFDPQGCCPDGYLECTDGSCTKAESKECCLFVGEKTCIDGSCASTSDPEGCCPTGQKECSDGTCAFWASDRDQGCCQPGQRDCNDDRCLSVYDPQGCCPDGTFECENGSCVFDLGDCCPPGFLPNPDGGSECIEDDAEPPYLPAGVFRDPFLTTFDGLSYECQGRGEFILLSSDYRAMQIQARFEGVTTDSATVTTALLMTMEEMPAVQVSIAATEFNNTNATLISACPVQLHINGTIRQIEDGSIFPTLRLKKRPNELELFERTSKIKIRILPQPSSVFGCFFSFLVLVPVGFTDDFGTTLTGLLGEPDGNPFNDWNSRDGTTLPVSGRFGKRAYDYCVDTWCIWNETESAFTYEEETDFDFYHKCDLPWSPVDLSRASDQLRQLCNGDLACLIEGIVGDVTSASQLLELEEEEARLRAQIQPERAMNEFCENALGPVPADGIRVEGSKNVGYGDEKDMVCDSNVYSAWYTFTGTGRQMMVTSCSNPIAIYDSNDCSICSVPIQTKTKCENGPGDYVLLMTSRGAQYKIRVAGGSKKFEISISEVGQDTGVECLRHSDCLSGHCYNGFCRNRPQNVGEVCHYNKNEDCTNGVCAFVYGTDVSICCPSGTFETQNLKRYCTGQQIGEPCLTNSMCTSSTCVGGRCVGSRGSEGDICDYGDASDCFNESCGYVFQKQNINNKPDLNAICCPGGLTLENDGVMYCRDLSTGSPCDSNAMCASGVCLIGQCVPGLQGIGSACDENEDCENNACGITGGKFTVCCPSGKVLESSGISRCTGLDPGSWCDTNLVCTSGVCNDGHCLGAKQQHGSLCDNGQDDNCANGVCGRVFDSPESICCPSDATVKIDSVLYCSQLPFGHVCGADILCKSGLCRDEKCTEPPGEELYTTCDYFGGGDECGDTGVCGWLTNQVSICCPTSAVFEFSGTRCARVVHVGGDCFDNSMCASGVCVAQRCVPYPQDLGQKCDVDDGPKDCAEGSCGKVFGSSYISGPETSICCLEVDDASGYCKSLPAGSACDRNSLCASSSCVKGYCAQDPPSEGDICDVTSQCADGLICARIPGQNSWVCCRNDNVLNIGNTAYCGNRAAGQTCITNDVCASGVCVRSEVCVNGKQDQGNPCNEADDCLNETCGTKTTSVRDKVCCPSNAIIGHSCTEQSIGRPCTGNSVCASSVCIDGLCANQKRTRSETCDDDDDCDNGACGYVYGPTASRHTSNSQLERLCCPSDAKTGHRCSYVEEVGSYCSSNSHCKSGICAGNKCVAEKQADGEVCDLVDGGLDCANNVCGKILGSSWPNEAQICCPSGASERDYCTGQGVGDPCFQNSLCASEVCVNGVCQEGGSAIGEACDYVDGSDDCAAGICAMIPESMPYSYACCSSRSSSTETNGYYHCINE